MNREFTLTFDDSGMWIINENVDGVLARRGEAGTLEEAVRWTAINTGRPVSISLIAFLNEARQQ